MTETNAAVESSPTQSKLNRPRGTGSIYQQKGSSNWWIQYYRNGKVYRQSAGTAKRRQAERLLQTKLAEIANHTFIAPRSERTLVKELAEDVFRDYKIREQKSLDDAKTRWEKHLALVFGDLRAANVDGEQLVKYVDKRQTEGASNATINRELAVLRRAYSLGQKHKKVFRVPDFPERLDERNVRKGFLGDKQYANLAAACGKRGLWLRAMFEVAYTFGCRLGELLKLRVRHVDLIAKTILLEDTKNGEDRSFKMTSLVYALIQQCVTGKQPDDFVFTWPNGKPVRDFRGTWAAVCAEAGVPDLLFHDLRRTAVRNMVRRGIPDRVAMKISGHKTRSVFDRYNIVSEGDLDEATAKLEKKAPETLVQSPETLVPNDYSHSSDIVGSFSAPVANDQKLN